MIFQIIQPLNLETILVSYFAGGWTIFFFIAMIFFAFMAAKFKMPNSIFLMLNGLFVVLMANYYSLLFTITIFIAGLFFYYTLSKIIKT